MDEERFDPCALPVMVQREAEIKASVERARAGAARQRCLPRWLPMLSPHYRSHPGKCGNCYVVTLDVPAYLATHLVNYRAGWPDFLEQWKPEEAWLHFNELDGEGCDVAVEVAAYMGHWPRNAARGDVVREHGGNVGDYDVAFPWGTSHADAVLAVCPLADPRSELPPDHPAAQCDGQGTLL